MEKKPQTLKEYWEVMKASRRKKQANKQPPKTRPGIPKIEDALRRAGLNSTNNGGFAAGQPGGRPNRETYR